MIVGFYLAETGEIEKIRNIKIVTWTTIIFGVLLYFSDKFKLEKSIGTNFTFKSAIFIGFLQILSLIPGVTGGAITAARLLNFKRVDAAKISFLLSIPILGSVSAYGFRNILFSEDIDFTIINFVAIILSFLFSLFTIKFFLRYINNFNLNIFVYYRILLGVCF